MTRILYLTNCFHVGSVKRHVEEAFLDRDDLIFHVGDDRIRMDANCPDIHSLVAKYPSLEETWTFEQRADGAIYVASPERHIYTRPLHHMEIIRRDLIAAGRDPERFPVVFEVLRLEYDDPVATEEELAKVLRWPWSDRIDTITGPKVPKEQRHHDLPVRRLLEMIERGPV